VTLLFNQVQQAFIWNAQQGCNGSGGLWEQKSTGGVEAESDSV